MPRPSHIRDEWARCRDWLLPAIVDTTEKQVLEELLANKAQLFRGEGAAIVTTLMRKDGLALVLWLGGGSLAGILELRPGVEAWGRYHGATAAWINGRRGWDRVLKPCGYVRRDGELMKIL